MKKPQAFRELKTDHLKCRSLTHPWDPKQTTKVTIEGRPVYEVYLVCLRCESEATDYIYVSDGTRAMPRQYHHIDGYLIDNVPSWGGRREFNGNVRRELYSRLLNGRR